ncbi:hypothetical protein OV287_50490 [Archangium sp. miwbw1]|uniref:Uncharacterized protein n=1 Tax=Archangium lansingense TaxID=2995310 RepID=A0ABT4ALY6_9BACT|nr:hypothetical protein [Archangium lansinium]MCY1082709.1 hypothetical protein [Archangium lansinium]
MRLPFWDEAPPPGPMARDATAVGANPTTNSLDPSTTVLTCPAASRLTRVRAGEANAA